MYAVVSAFGIVFLVIIGSLFSANAYTLVKGAHPIEDSAGAGRDSLYAAALYVLLLIFCLQQIQAHKRNSLQLQ